MARGLRIHPSNPKVLEYHGAARMLVCATEHYGAVVNRAFRFERYLEEAAARSQTLTRLFLLFRELQTDRNPYSTIKPESPDFVAPFARTGPGAALDGEPRYDLSRWNPEYFDRLHRFLFLAHGLGIVVEVTLFSNTYAPHIWALNPLNARNNINGTEEIEWPEYLTLRHPELLRWQLTYARKVIEETRQYDNIVYEVCNEPGGRAPGRSSNPDCAEVNLWQREIVRLIREVDAGYGHLVSGQEAFAYEPFTQGTDLSFTDMPFDIVNVHPLPGTTFHGETYNMGEFMSKQLALRPYLGFCQATGGQTRPLNLDEDNVASQYKDVDGWTIHRKRAWMSLMSLRHYDYIDFSIIPSRETGTEESRANIRSWMGHLSRYIHSVDLARAAPRTDVLLGSPPHTLSCVLAVEGQDYSVYLADARELSEPGAGGDIDGSAVLDLPRGSWHAALFSPRTGLYSPWIDIGRGGRTEVHTPRFQHDIVIRVQAATMSHG